MGIVGRHAAIVAALTALGAPRTGVAFVPSSRRASITSSSSWQQTSSSLPVLAEPTDVKSSGDDDGPAAPAVKPQQITADKLPPPPFTKVMAANRAEISVRIQRAVTELNMASVAIYVDEDRYGQHRWGADESYVLSKAEGATPISAYLDIDQIINIARESGVDAIHPGYGFLSESPQFAQACGDAGITFVGPTVENLNTFSDKTSAREAAIAAGVPVMEGSDLLANADEVNAFVDEIGLPVIIKAAMGEFLRVDSEEEDLTRP